MALQVRRDRLAPAGHGRDRVAEENDAAGFFRSEAAMTTGGAVPQRETVPGRHRGSHRFSAENRTRRHEAAEQPRRLPTPLHGRGGPGTTCGTGGFAFSAP